MKVVLYIRVGSVSCAFTLPEEADALHSFFAEAEAKEQK